MNLVHRVLAVIVVLSGMSFALSVQADDALPQLGTPLTKAQVAKNALDKDAVCTRCHDETETMPILAIYQTEHGVKGDPRTPNCQTCHGESKNHLAGNVSGGATTTRPKPFSSPGPMAISRRSPLSSRA